MSNNSFKRPTRMHGEINEIPSALHRLLNNSYDSIVSIAKDIYYLDPQLVTTVARGSSDHVATYIKYAIELLAGVPVASIGPYPSPQSITHRYSLRVRLTCPFLNQVEVLILCK